MDVLIGKVVVIATLCVGAWFLFRWLESRKPPQKNDPDAT